MTTAFQQQVFALDARYNAHRAPNHPNFRTLYIRRRSQLLRDANNSSTATENARQYLKLRALLLHKRYGSPLENVPTPSLVHRSASRTSDASDRAGNRVAPAVVPTKQANASRAIVGGTSIAENYAFVGVHHIFDQHAKAVTMVKFANNDKSKLCCCSLDGTVSVCSVSSDGDRPAVTAVLKGHGAPVMSVDWSANNDLIASSSMDGTVRLWSVANGNSCLRTLPDKNASQIFCCMFQPLNNNLIVTGNGRGEVQMVNASTGRQVKGGVCRVGGQVLSLAADANGRLVWAGNTKGEIVSVLCEADGGLHAVSRLRLNQPCSITSLSYRAWISREARDPTLLVNCTANALFLFRVTAEQEEQGRLQFKRSFHNRHRSAFVRSSFCPIMSFRQGACVVTGSEDGCVYFLDVEKPASRANVNTLQGHASAVLGVSFNYDESLLATSDLQGLVILWRRAN